MILIINDDCMKIWHDIFLYISEGFDIDKIAIMARVKEVGYGSYHFSISVCTVFNY